MGYARSSSFKALQSHLLASRRVVNAAGKIRFGGKRKKLFQEAMLSSAILLAFANFESYVGDVLNDLCKGLCSAGLDASKLPQELRAQLAILSSLHRWSEIKDPTKLQANVWAHKASGGFSILEDSFVPANLDVESLISKNSYPKFDNLKKLMLRVGIKDPRDKLKKKGGHAIEQKLTSIHDARAELAHTGRLPVWTIKDYIDRLTDLEDFARAFDKVLCQHFCQHALISAWII